MSNVKPTLDEVREVLSAMIEQPGWIGEGDEIATELLAYIDGESPDTLDRWTKGMDEWAYIVDPNEIANYRGPFDTERQAREFLASMPEKAVAVSPIGPTLDRDAYVVMSRAELHAAQAAETGKSSAEGGVTCC